MTKNNGTLRIITAGVLWGIISLFVTVLSDAGLSPMQIAFVRLFTAALILTIFTAVKSPKLLKFRLSDIWMFAGTGIFSVVLFNCCYFYTMIHGEASIAVVLLYTSPIFIMLISKVLFKEKLTAVKLYGLILTVVGCIFVSGAIGSGHKISAVVFIIGIGSGLFYGLYTIFGKIALEKYDSLTITVYTFIFGALVSLPICGVGEIIHYAADDPSLLMYCLLIGVICTLLPYYLYTSGLENSEAGKAAILVAVEPLVGAIIGMTILHESRDVLKITGIVLILTAIILLNRRSA